MLHLRFNLTEKEFYHFNYYTAWAAPERKSYRLWYLLRVLLLYGAVALLYIAINHSDQWEIDLLIFGVIGLLYFLMIPFLVKRSIRSRVKNILSKKENQFILQDSEVIIDDNSILDKDSVSESKYDWDAIIRSAETEDCFYLYTNSYHAIVIPKRILSESDNRELRRLLTVNLPLSSEL